MFNPCLKKILKNEKKPTSLYSNDCGKKKKTAYHFKEREELRSFIRVEAISFFRSIGIKTRCSYRGSRKQEVNLPALDISYPYSISNNVRANKNW